MTSITKTRWLLDGAFQDPQTVTPDWVPLLPTPIAGVRICEVRHVAKRQGHLTELFRREWAPDNGTVDQVFQVVLNAGAVSAWHAHEHTTDRLFVTLGLVRLALYDAREDSPTFGQINEVRIGLVRPALVIIPPKVWHGVQNIGDGPGIVVNITDRAYDYERPDHWRLPQDTALIPFSW